MSFKGGSTWTGGRLISVRATFTAHGTPSILFNPVLRDAIPGLSILRRDSAILYVLANGTYCGGWRD
ncbi:hypothetical protein QL848_002580 [Enterococcus faecium]|nr:hypothetical protein [Enterococcus faecium]